LNKNDFSLTKVHSCMIVLSRVAELGSLSSGTNGHENFRQAHITIFATNASFLRGIGNLQI